MSPITISALLIQEDTGMWSAQCLEYDVAAQAKTLPDLYYELERTLAGHVVAAAERGADPFVGLPAAPEEYWKRFQQSTMKVQADKMPFRASRPVQIPVPELRIAA